MRLWWRCSGLIVIAVALGGQAPQKSAQAGQAQTQTKQGQSAATVAANAQTIEPIQPSEYYRPCEKDRKNDNSDLCAQWTAANGAREAAYWAKLSFWTGLFGVVGLLVTLYYTRKAVLAAEEGTKDADAALAIARENANAARQQAIIAREAMEGQLRPWVFIDRIEVRMVNMQRMDAVVIFKNFGNWPAKRFAKTCEAKLVAYPFWAEALLEPDKSLTTLIPPAATETMELTQIPWQAPANQKVRIRIATSYLLPSGVEETAHEEFMIDQMGNGQFAARKVVGYDSANHPIHSEKK
jgi:hypothetical protein